MVEFCHFFYNIVLPLLGWYSFFPYICPRLRLLTRLLCLYLTQYVITYQTPLPIFDQAGIAHKPPFSDIWGGLGLLTRLLCNICPRLGLPT